MIPRSRHHALLTVLEAERRVKQLATECYRQWLPLARKAVLPTLTAAAEEPLPPPPQPEALALTQADWEAILAAVFLPGLAELMWEQMTAELAGLGVTAGDLITLLGELDIPVIPDGVDRPTRMPEPGEQQITPELVAAVPSVQAWTTNYLGAVNNRMVRTPDTAFAIIADELVDATREGESIREMHARIAAVLDIENLETFGGRRPSLVARTETAGALNAARLESARVMGEITGETLQKAWLATIDTRTRTTHFAADGQRVDLDGDFQLANGVKLRWPGDPEAPASEVCNCRCAIMILADDEELPAEDDRHTERGPGDATVRNRAGTREDEIERRREEEGVIRARDDPAGVGQINAAAPPPERIPTMRTFTAVLAHLGVPTDDDRLLDATMDLRFRDTPLPLRWQRQDVPAHGEAFTIGVIDTIGLDGTQVVATGHLLDTAEAAEAELQIRESVTRPSIDLADVDWELRDEDGNLITEDSEIADDTRLIMTVTSAIVTAATLVSIPAFGTTSITLDEALAENESIAAAAVLTASAPRFRPDPALFADPGFTAPTALHITDNGRVQGHLAVFDTCHVGISDRCVTPPRSVTGYAHFHTSAIECSTGHQLPVGRLTVGAGHADHALGARAAAEHYDNTATCWAYVRAGEDAHGIWVSGLLHPDATDAQVRDGLSAPLSGDWRSIGGHLELVAALSVNTPGFPVLRGRDDERGRSTVLVASLAPRPRARALDTSILRSVAIAAVREYRTSEARLRQARAVISDRRRAEAAALVAAVNNGKG
ncbi:phage head morphogenesis protein [Nocardia sp. CDC159]|uniref:Phage head morphogenesis protein n=1 Tax=Nocardia pulmonis TaxID=2951408 RepID=A0A9X2E738_9NOCA|nr:MULTISPECIES: phage minor head protein [Nocardia]MCM6774994.1 phage head morphogenesis protein [Nocardia pulmonis]MCM6789925.1 phage head morphogenesis protein [Nocardia sp. CDC159]